MVSSSYSLTRTTLNPFICRRNMHAFWRYLALAQGYTVYRLYERGYNFGYPNRTIPLEMAILHCDMSIYIKFVVTHVFLLMYLPVLQTEAWLKMLQVIHIHSATISSTPSLSQSPCLCGALRRKDWTISHQMTKVARWGSGDLQSYLMSCSSVFMWTPSHRSEHRTLKKFNFLVENQLARMTRPVLGYLNHRNQSQNQEYWGKAQKS